MYKAYNQVLWGIVIILININIEQLNLMPNFLGYILIVIGLSKIITENTSTVDTTTTENLLLNRLKVFSNEQSTDGLKSEISSAHYYSAKKAIVLAGLLAAYSFTTIFVGEPFGIIVNHVIMIVFLTVDMLMCYLILSSGLRDANREILLRQQKVYLLIATIAVSASCAAIIIQGILLISVIFGFASRIYFIYLCHVLKSQFKTSTCELAT